MYCMYMYILVSSLLIIDQVHPKNQILPFKYDT